MKKLIGFASVSLMLTGLIFTSSSFGHQTAAHAVQKMAYDAGPGPMVAPDRLAYDAGPGPMAPLLMHVVANV